MSTKCCGLPDHWGSNGEVDQILLCCLYSNSEDSHLHIGNTIIEKVQDDKGQQTGKLLYSGELVMMVNFVSSWLDHNQILGQLLI